MYISTADDEETVCIDVANGEEPPKEFMEMLFDDTVTKTAFNANFERICFSNYYQHSFRPEAWKCTAVQAAMLALPFSLEGVGAVLGLDKQKMTEGKELIKYFCSPCKATKSNGGRTRNLPKDAPEKWRLFKNRYGRDWLNFLSRKGNRKFTVWIRESMTVELWWIVIL